MNKATYRVTCQRDKRSRLPRSWADLIAFLYPLFNSASPYPYFRLSTFNAVKHWHIIAYTTDCISLLLNNYRENVTNVKILRGTIWTCVPLHIMGGRVPSPPSFTPTTTVPCLLFAFSRTTARHHQWENLQRFTMPFDRLYAGRYRMGPDRFGRRSYFMTNDGATGDEVSAWLSYTAASISAANDNRWSFCAGAHNSFRSPLRQTARGGHIVVRRRRMRRNRDDSDQCAGVAGN